MKIPPNSIRTFSVLQALNLPCTLYNATVTTGGENDPIVVTGYERVVTHEVRAKESKLFGFLPLYSEEVVVPKVSYKFRTFTF